MIFVIFFISVASPQTVIFDIYLVGPPQMMIFGNMLQIDSVRAHVSICEMAEKWGDTISINLLGKPVVVVSGLEEIREVLITKSNDFAGQSGICFMYILKQMLKDDCIHVNKWIMVKEKCPR